MISVIVPVYKTEKYLERCIRSILNNTYKDLEIICINDSSPDHCLLMLKQLADEDLRIRIIDQENQGVPSARKNGLSVAKGEYISFIDSDDWVHPQYFQTLLDCAEQYRADIVICGCCTFCEGDELPIEEYETVRYRKLSDKQFFKDYYTRHMCWGRIYRKDSISDIDFPPEVSLGDDTLFNLRVVSRLKKPIVYHTETPMYYYLQREGSIIRSWKYIGLVGFPEWVQKNHLYNKENEWSWMLLIQAVKFCLSYRYEAQLRKEEEKADYANRLLNDLTKRLFKNSHASTKDKAIHFIATASPALYRHFRIKNDPTMLKWEETIKTSLITK